jgi:hypothetical protein
MLDEKRDKNDKNANVRILKPSPRPSPERSLRSLGEGSLTGRQKRCPSYDSTKWSGKGDFLEKHLVPHACKGLGVGEKAADGDNSQDGGGCVLESDWGGMQFVQLKSLGVRFSLTPCSHDVHHC